MEQMTLTPSRRLEARRAYGRTTDAFETVAWRPPSPARFENRVANDVTSEPEPTLSEMVDGVPAWLTITLGGVVAALAGAMLGGALHI
ncbi:hypothetical protein N0B44_06825 [Roseibacterium beibuensis]|uniref:hypothetical protein n=1 Tax=[Roseibacterium] beibuensis TaxID=1193142 RepID=UPI00217DCC81|nr:hypothetical protein [Roseibacterium beibuensis]MCS6622617.1 hypothetical protein [Roseibacterium beibuensis]